MVFFRKSTFDTTRLTLTLDVLKFLPFETEHDVAERLTLTLDVLKYIKTRNEWEANWINLNIGCIEIV